MSDSLTCHYYHRCICIGLLFSFLIILMLMIFKFHLMWWSLGFLFSLFHSVLGRGKSPLSSPSAKHLRMFLQPCNCSKQPFPSILCPQLCQSGHALLCPVTSLLGISIAFTVLGVVEGSKIKQSRECQSVMIVERTSVQGNTVFWLFILALGIPNGAILVGHYSFAYGS